MIRFFIPCLLACVGMAAPAAARVAVGVPDFEHQGDAAAGVAAATRGIVEEELGGRVQLVERARLADVLEELSFQQSGVTEPGGAAEIGRAGNVQLLLFGEVGRLSSDEFSLSLRLVEVATDRVVRSEEARVPGTGPRLAATARRLAQRLAIAAVAQVSAEYLFIPSARLLMGSVDYPEEGPVHEVHIDSFFFDRTEVSRAAYAVFAETRTGELPIDADPDLPATGVAWADAAGYCGWAGKRLPTEAEWELAARGAEGRRYPWGAASPAPHLARFAGAGGRQPTVVGDLEAGATPQGVLNLAGNAAEWVADWWHPRYDSGGPSDNPTGPGEGDYRVVRGGGFLSGADELRSTARAFHNPQRGAAHIGFRCASSTPPSR